MSSLNSPRGEGYVVNVDDFAVASSVIKALRSSSNSNRHYKQNAARDDHLVTDINQFNKIIKDRSENIQRFNAVEQQINDALNNYIPPSKPMVVMNSPNERKNRQEMKKSSELDSDSDDEALSSPPQHSDTISHFDGPHSHSKGRLAAPTADTNFDSDIDDDPAETAELMRNFIAPSSNSHNTSSTKNRSSAQSFKGTSSNTSSSIKYGAGGIRGIQHAASMQRSMDKDSDDTISINSTSNASQYTTATSHTTYTTHTQNTNKLLHIKPGQAIRVKAPNKKSRSSINSNNGNFNTVG